VIGTLADLPGLAERCGAELVYLALGREEWEAEQEALDRLSDSTAAVRLVPDLARAYTLNASVEDFDGTPVVLVTESPEQGWNQVLKRAFDLVFSAVGLIVLSPVLAAVAIWVKADSPGPVFFAQDRVGMNGRRFRMLKFRTMRVGADAAGAGWTTKDDPRRTGAGAVLRRFSLDELPQLWNVFVGNMSLVGPRPEQPTFVEQFRGSIPRYMLRHHVKAGITGWAQVNGLRGDTPLERRIEYDLYYIQNWSLLFDLRILALTVARVFRDPTAA
jgi:Undecaprenyl-phosphate glucose phosphotransferase